MLSGSQAIPPHVSPHSGSATFMFDTGNNTFSGSASVNYFSSVNAVTIFRSTDPSSLGTMVYTLTPGQTVFPGPNGEPGIRTYDLALRPTAQDVSDLQSGLWYVNVSTVEFPVSDLRAQIIIAPEPTTLAILILGVAIGGSKVYCRRKSSPP